MTSLGMDAASIANDIVKIQIWHHCLVWTVSLVTVQPVFLNPTLLSSSLSSVNESSILCNLLPIRTYYVYP